jgi:hypothetical protein
MDEKEISAAWDHSRTPELEAMKASIEAEAFRHNYELDLSEILYLAFKAGYQAEADRAAC